MSLLIQRIAESCLLKFTHLLHQLVSIPMEGNGCKVCFLSFPTVFLAIWWFFCSLCFLNHLDLLRVCFPFFVVASICFSSFYFKLTEDLISIPCKSYTFTNSTLPYYVLSESKSVLLILYVYFNFLKFNLS